MITILLTIALLHWVVLLTPGVNFVLVSQLAASGHRKSALLAALGVTVVTLTWATLAILGVGIVFSTHPALRQFFQIAGGLYLCYVALRLWQSAGSTQSVAHERPTHWAAFRLGFLTNILNPKTALFFGSVFATALPHNPGIPLALAAVGLVYANALAWHVFLALAFSHPRVQAGYARQVGRLNRLSSALVGAFGVKLLNSTVQELRARAT